MPEAASPQPKPKTKPKDSIGVIPTSFATHGPKSVPRVDYERIFILDAKTKLVGEYALDDDCPLESGDLRRSLPVNGLRHLVSFYQGEYAFTPFKVDDLWFVVLTRGVPRIEDRGSVGTLLAAARIHIPPMIEPLLAKKEAELHAKEEELAQREAELERREQRTGTVEEDLRGREARIAAVHDYAAKIERTYDRRKDAKSREPSSSVAVTPP